MNKKENILFNILTYILLVIYPLIVIKINVFTGLNDYPWYYGSNNNYDYFLLFKSYILVFISLLMLLSLIIELTKIKTTLSLFFKNYRLLSISIIIYVVALITSTFLSINKKVSISGSFGQYEGIFVLLSYIVIFIYYIVNRCYFTKLIHNSIFINSLFVQSCLYFIIALSQGKQVFLTLYNSDYASTYMLMYIPLTVYLALNTDSKIIKIIRLIICCLLVRTFIFMNTTFPIFIFIFELLILLMFYFIIKNDKLCNILNKSKIKTYLCSGFVIFIAVILLGYCIYSSSDSSLSCTELGISEIITTDDGVKVILNGETKIFTDDIFSSSKELSYNKAKFSSKLYGELNGFIIKNDYEEMFFTKEIDGTYKFVQSFDKATDLCTAERSIFTRSDGIIKGREYIWGRTIPIIKKQLVFGVGPDAFTYAFPHNDYVQALNTGYLYQLITKPHNIYLQILCQTGIFVFVSVLLFIFISYHSFCKTDCKVTMLDLIILTSVTAFLLSGLLNDSCVAVTPLFYILLGVQAGNNSTHK